MGESGTPVKALVEEIQQREAKRASLDREIALVEDRAGLGQLNVARALGALTPVLAGWGETLRGNPVCAREVLRKLIIGPIVMEPLPAHQGYRWRGQLNGGAVLEGVQKYPMCRGSGTNTREPD